MTLTKKVGVETDKNKRQAMIEEAFNDCEKGNNAYTFRFTNSRFHGVFNSSISCDNNVRINALEFRYVILP